MLLLVKPNGSFLRSLAFTLCFFTIVSIALFLCSDNFKYKASASCDFFNKESLFLYKSPNLLSMLPFAVFNSISPDLVGNPKKFTAPPPSLLIALTPKTVAITVPTVTILPANEPNKLESPLELFVRILREDVNPCITLVAPEIGAKNPSPILVETVFKSALIVFNLLLNNFIFASNVFEARFCESLVAYSVYNKASAPFNL